MNTEPENFRSCRTLGRRNFLVPATSACLVAPVASAFPQLGAPGGALSKEQRDQMTPAQVIEELKKGNERFRAGKMTSRDYLTEQRATAGGQYPAAVILGCIDSRVPAEIIFDVGIGEIFNARVAGNVPNKDLLGSMEFACAVAGAKVVLVLGHTACGAVKGAIDNVELGNLTGLLNEIKPAIPATQFDGDKSSKNSAYVDAVALTNVGLAIKDIRSRSSVLADLEKKGSLKFAGAMYNLATGVASFTA